MRQGTVKAGQGQLNRRWGVWVYVYGCVWGLYVCLCDSGVSLGVVRGAVLCSDRTGEDGI